VRFPVGLSASLAAYIARKKAARERYVPLVLMLEPLFACNLSCSTCGRIREYRDRVAHTMTLDECLEAARECGAPVVSVCGGEPLIYPDIGRLVSALVEMRRYVYLCTNGVLLARSLHKLTPSRRLIINVHIDGPPEVHDAIVEKPGAYEAAVNGMVAARKLGFQLTVNTTVCRNTDMRQIDAMMDCLSQIGVGTFMLSPAFSYESVEDQGCFLSRADIRRKFQDIDTLAARHRLADTPIYLEFLKGQRELSCTAWGNPTRNPEGWRSPCYLIADRHFSTYRELVEQTDWARYGVDRDPRCRDCMVHCGFEPTAALMVDRHAGDLWKMIRWQFG